MCSLQERFSDTITEVKRLDNEPSIELRTTTHEPAAR